MSLRRTDLRTAAGRDALLEVPIAHRGLHGEGTPENSLAAFEAACRAGVGIELDVHPVGPDAVAVFHDYALDRMCGTPGDLADQDRGSLRQLRLAGTSEHVPVLEEALELVSGQVPLAIELKRPEEALGRAVLCARVARLLASYAGPAAVMSFDPGLLRWFARRAPAVPRVQLGASRKVPEVAEAVRALGVPWWKVVALEHLAVALVSRPHLVGYDVRPLPRLAVSLARRLGRPLLTGVIMTEDELATAAREADGIVFEGLDPGLVRRSWPPAGRSRPTRPRPRRPRSGSRSSPPRRPAQEAR